MSEGVRVAPKYRTYANAWAEQIPKLDAAGISLTYLSIGDSAGFRAPLQLKQPPSLSNVRRTLNPKP